MSTFEPTDWDARFLGLAKHVAGWSKDPSTKTGAVIVEANNVIVSIGYNGFPRLVVDDPIFLGNRDEKYRRIIHAEVNAILFRSIPTIGCTIYTWPFGPCARCAAVIIQTGIQRVVAPYLEPESPLFLRWQKELASARDMFQQAGLRTDFIPEKKL